MPNLASHIKASRAEFGVAASCDAEFGVAQHTPNSASRCILVSLCACVPGLRTPIHCRFAQPFSFLSNLCTTCRAMLCHLGLCTAFTDLFNGVLNWPAGLLHHNIACQFRRLVTVFCTGFNASRQKRPSILSPQLRFHVACISAGCTSVRTATAP